MKRYLTLLLALGLLWPTAKAQKETKPIEVFCGAELGYADTNWKRLYDVMLNLTPGAKWHFADDWLFAVQGIVPVVTEGYTFREQKFHYIRLNTAVVSRQLHFSEQRQHFKLSAGLFGSERWGADVKWMMPVNDWLLLQAQAGLTNYWIMGGKPSGEGETNFGKKWTPTFQAGANVFLKSLRTELRGSGGRYNHGDYGLEGNVVSHFRHCSVDLFLQARLGKVLANEFDNKTDHINGGFRIVVMLPPYANHKRLTVGDVELRPASNFRLTNNVRSDTRLMKTYNTDPEDNERQLPIDVDWGIDGSASPYEK